MSRIDRVRAALAERFPEAHAEVLDETHGHNVPRDGQTHLRVRVVCASFEGMNRVKRQREVQRLLQPEFDTGLHALALELRTPAEWEKLGPSTPPPCRGGSGG